MKRQFIYGAMILALASAAGSCSDDQIIETTATPANQQTVTISASTTIGNVGGNTRATLGGDSGLTPVWQDDDKIAVLIDNATAASELTLGSGAGSGNGTFEGKVAVGENPQKMHFFYPASAAASTGVDLTSQDGSNAQEMVMYATCDYALDPEFTFTNKTSILKFNIPVPEACGWTSETSGLTATIEGAYSMGKLSADGTWTDLETADISVSDIKVSSDGSSLTGYAVVIPGSKATDLRISIFKDDIGYVTKAYTNEAATIPENKVVTISQPINVMKWIPGGISKEDVQKVLKIDRENLTIVATGEMETSDFTVFTKALSDMDEVDDITLNLTILNQATLPQNALSNCAAIKTISMPNVTEVGGGAFSGCSALTNISLPEVTTMGNSAFSGCTSLVSADLPYLRTVETYVFNDCTALKSLELPGASLVKEYAFDNCTSLNYVNLENADTVQEGAFFRCNTDNIALIVKDGSTWWDTEYYDEDRGEYFKEYTWKSVTER